MTYLIPAAYTGMSSWDAHNDRRPPSSEPGTDYYMPTGTPLLAPARCQVVEVGGGIGPATGRFTTLDDGTRWIRYLHQSEWLTREGDWLDAGEVFGLSGASGYGSEFFGEPYRNDAFWRNTGGDHVHVTAFRQRYYVWGKNGSTDFHAMTSGKFAGGASTITPKVGEEEDEDMAMKGLSYIRASDGATIVAQFNEVSGFYHEVEGTTGAYNTPIAQAWEVRGAESNNGSWPVLSESDVIALKRDLAAVRTGKS